MTLVILPSQRELVTNLVASLCQTSPRDDTDSQATADGVGQQRSSSSLATRDLLCREQLILTLHVIFPDMLLPALDLLDRNLVRRVLLGGYAKQRLAAGDMALEGTENETGKDLGLEDSADAHRVYTVRSQTSTWHRRGGYDTAAAAPMYLVHLGAWNCSCAGFALQTYTAPAYTSGAGTASSETEPIRETESQDRHWYLRASKFGGLSINIIGGAAETLPCCKHMLACLLADQWGNVLESYVESKTCSREELAAIVVGV